MKRSAFTRRIERTSIHSPAASLHDPVCPRAIAFLTAIVVRGLLCALSVTPEPSVELCLLQ